MNRRNGLVSKKSLAVVIAIFSIATMSSFYFQKKEWESPKSADAKKNTLTKDVGTIAAGKAVYVKECQSCHGKSGKGDGPSAAQLDVQAGDLSGTATQAHSDGALFWKISEGRKPMPSFKKKLTEAQIWQSVVYMRTLKK